MRALQQRLIAVTFGALALGIPRSATAQFRDSVWVNARSGVYHCPGTEYYGRTTRGEYLSERVARERGFRANGGRACHPGSAPMPPIAGIASASPLGEPRLSRDTRECVLGRITDGDSIECTPFGRVRLIGSDSPERDQPSFGTAATAGLASLLPMGAMLRLELDAEERDPYGRLLAYVWYEDRMVNWLMIRQGWGVSVRYPPNTRHATAFDSAEAVARRELRGLWIVDGFRCRPADFRRRAC